MTANKKEVLSISDDEPIIRRTDVGRRPIDLTNVETPPAIAPVQPERTPTQERKKTTPPIFKEHDENTKQQTTKYNLTDIAKIASEVVAALPTYEKMRRRSHDCKASV